MLHSTALGAAYLKLGDIKGEATDKDHKDWINLGSVSFDLERITDGTSTGATRAGQAASSPIRVRKGLDKSSPLLALGLFSGQHFAEATIVFVQPGPGGRNEPYLVYKLKNVIITSYSISGDADDRPTEEVAFYYNKIAWTYFPVDSVGRPSDPVSGGWDVEKNAPFEDQ
jgi:type VI secretion system Hcp family effector